MAINIDFTMFDTTNPKLSKSADALESALAQLSKNTPFGTANIDNASPVVTATAVSNNGGGFDEWLANDFQLAGALSGDDVASLTSSPYSALDDSPILGFDSFGSAMGPSLFDMGLGFGQDLVSAPSSVPATPVMASPAQAKIPAVAVAPLLTTAAVQQAAAALNIPWSHDLELAVLAQAQAAASSSSIGFPQNNNSSAPAMIIPKIEPAELSFSTLAASMSIPSAPASSSPSISASSAAAATAHNKRSLSPEDEQEEVVAKRAKNTDAARRSRLKKLVRLETLEAKVSELETTNNRLTMKVAILETEKNGHLSKEADQSVRIAQLEAKLAEAHAALTSRASA